MQSVQTKVHILKGVQMVSTLILPVCEKKNVCLKCTKIVHWSPLVNVDVLCLDIQECIDVHTKIDYKLFVV